MSLHENTKNAFQVVIKTYENIEKLLTEVDRVGKQSGFTSLTPRFLRWKSDNDCGGWLITSFIKLFQDIADSDLHGCNGLKDGYIYGLEVDLLNDPQIILSRFRFDNLKVWKGLPAVSEHWGFYHPLRGTYGDFILSDFDYDGQKYRLSKPNPTNKKTAERYWDLQEVVFKYDTLMDISSRNIKVKVFDVFRTLSEIPIVDQS